MSEENKRPEEPAEETAQQEPVREEQPAQETARDQSAADKAEKGSKAKKKKEKTYTLTREQMEAAELAAKQLESVKDQFTRLTAEYDNYRKRTAKEKEGIYANAKIDTIKGMLPVYDNLERGLAQFDAEDDDPHKKGLEMIFNQYKEALTKLGVTPIDCVGKEFDPERHNAVMHIEDESCGENTVVEVLQQGFMLGDKVLRFAIVKVAN